MIEVTINYASVERDTDNTIIIDIEFPEGRSYNAAVYTRAITLALQAHANQHPQSYVRSVKTRLLPRITDIIDGQRPVTV